MATRRFDGIIRELVTVDTDGLSLNSIVSGSRLGDTQSRSGTLPTITSEPVITNDPKGIGELILAADEPGR